MDAMRWIETVVSAALAFALAAPSAANVLHVPSDHLTVTGVVTFARSGDLFVFLRQDDGTCVRLGLLGGNRAFVGERIAAEGDVSMSEPNLRMENVFVSHLGIGEVPDRRQVKISALYAPAPPNWFGLPVEVTVRVMDVNRRRTQLQLYVSDLDREARGATASFPLRERDTSDPDLRIGAIVRIRAVPSLEYTPEGVKNLTLNILSKDDVEVLSRPSWWTPARVLTAVAIALFVLTALCGWVALLIRARRAEASSQEERLRLARDLPDEFQQQLAGTLYSIPNLLRGLVDVPRLLCAGLEMYFCDRDTAVRCGFGIQKLTGNHTRIGQRFDLFSADQLHITTPVCLRWHGKA